MTPDELDAVGTRDGRRDWTSADEFRGAEARAIRGAAVSAMNLSKALNRVQGQTPAEIPLIVEDLGPPIRFGVDPAQGPDKAAIWGEAFDRTNTVRLPTSEELRADLLAGQPKKAGASIDLGRYAGTYGGYKPNAPRTLAQRVREWRRRLGRWIAGDDE